MTALPDLLKGDKAIAAALGTSPGAVRHNHRQRLMPTFHVRGCICATPAALADWQALNAAGKLTG